MLSAFSSAHAPHSRIASLHLRNAVHPGTGFARRIMAKDDQYAWVSNIVVEGKHLRAVMKGNISLRDLKFTTRMWLNLVCTRLIPFKNTTHISVELANMAHEYNAQLFRLDKVIPSMIQHAVKEAMKPVVGKLGNFYAWVDILKNGVVVLRKEMDSQNAMVLPMDLDINLLVIASESPSMERCPLNDCPIRVNPTESATTK
ncbi:hypothetical protein HAX54_041190 [Datura stramonium]|uniref:Uncharacterized protein n=1 Tax=Datura stramonium TaxID=4076 RepID=A0ABS8VSP8_DATST|nr:hypothetical protein [Datura stramonium]